MSQELARGRAAAALRPVVFFYFFASWQLSWGWPGCTEIVQRQLTAMQQLGGRHISLVKFLLRLCLQRASDRLAACQRWGTPAWCLAHPAWPAIWSSLSGTLIYPTLQLTLGWRGVWRRRVSTSTPACHRQALWLARRMLAARRGTWRQRSSTPWCPTRYGVLFECSQTSKARTYGVCKQKHSH